MRSGSSRESTGTVGARRQVQREARAPSWIPSNIFRKLLLLISAATVDICSYSFRETSHFLQFILDLICYLS